MNNWILLILSLPTENSTVRMRSWRAVKASGAVVLRDGVYLLPNHEGCPEVFQRIMEDVKEACGSAFLLDVRTPEEQDLSVLFNRSQDYAQLAVEIEICHQSLVNGSSPADVVKPIRKLRKTFNSLSEIDFFPMLIKSRTEAGLTELEYIIGKLLAPDEPSAIEQTITKHESSEFCKRQWATRQRPWVDRLASAWLIRRLIDHDAEFIWLASVSDCPPDAISFDFDGAQFTHVGDRVTFETLLVSFGLDSPALNRLGRLVHCLDVGGVRPIEATGIEQVLAGLKDTILDDDRLLDIASGVFDGLYAIFRKEEESNVFIQSHH
ncbi:MAG: chromate resistance protein ChrB domain-containing protein [Methylococcaceae bacterium]